MAGIRTTTVTNCFIRLAAREPFHSQLAPHGRHSSWLYALFSSASCSSSFYFVFFFQHAAEDNVTLSWMNGWTGIRATGGRSFFEIEPINPGSILWTYMARSPTYWSNAYWRASFCSIHLLPIAIFVINPLLSVERNNWSLNNSQSCKHLYLA